MREECIHRDYVQGGEPWVGDASDGGVTPIDREGG